MSTTERSYAQIQWRKDILGLQMVNRKSRQFFIYGDPLLNVFNNVDKYVRIKRQDNYSSDVRAYHQGEIYGRLEEGTDDVTEEKIYRLTLYFGSTERYIKLDSSGEDLIEVVDKHEYLFPRVEFRRFVRAIETMLSQKAIFTMLLHQTDVMNFELEYDKEVALLAPKSDLKGKVEVKEPAKLGRADILGNERKVTGKSNKESLSKNRRSTR